MAPQLTITERREGPVTVVSLKGRLVVDEGDTLFTSRIDALVRAGRTSIVLDLHDLTALDSGGVGVLVAKYLTLRNRAGDLRLARLNDRTRRVLSITHLLTVFEIFESPADAIRSFALHPPAAVPAGSRSALA